MGLCHSSTRDYYSIVVGVYISWSLHSLALCPKHKPLEAWHWSVESPHYGEKPTFVKDWAESHREPLALWAGAVGLLHSSTQGYCSIVVGLMLNPPPLLSYLACMSVLHCVLGKGYQLYCLSLLVWVYWIVCLGRVNDLHVPNFNKPGLLPQTSKIYKIYLCFGRKTEGKYKSQIL